MASEVADVGSPKVQSPGGVTGFVWVNGPAAIARTAPSWAKILLDGYYLLAFRRLAGVLPLIAFVIGLILGAQRLGYSYTIFESAFLLGLFLAVGMASAHLGAALVGGFAIGDFLLAGRAWTLAPARFTSEEVLVEGVMANLLRIRLPLLISYLLLALAVIYIPVLTKHLVASLPLRDRWPKHLVTGFVLAGMVAIVYFLVHYWSQAAGVMLRPLFEWQVDIRFSSGPFAVNIVEVVQQQGKSLAFVAALTIGVRVLLQATVTDSERLDAPVKGAQLRLQEIWPEVNEPGRLRLTFMSFYKAALVILLFAGLLSNLIEATVALLVIFGLGLFTTGVVPLPLGRWPEIANSIPLILRLALLLFLMQRILGPSVADQLDGKTFTPFLSVTILGTILFALLIPPPPRVKVEEQEQQEELR